VTVRHFFTASPAPLASFERSDRPEISFVIVTYGTGPVVTQTLAALSASQLPSEAEVIVVDNPHPVHATRSAAELTLSTAGVHVLQPSRNLGFGGGCELGALHARGRYLAFVNPDISVEAGWIEPLLDAVHNEHTSIVAPVLLDADGSIQEVGQRLYATGATAPNSDPPSHIDTAITVDYASAACWLIRRDEHERIGGFDPAYHPAYFEDVDLALRARQLGGSVVVHPGSRIVHHRGTGTPDQAEPASTQRDILLDTWPTVRWSQPVEPAAT
jgi:GT2 family glycosyltransferase